jgi:hypothetical protein
MPHKKEAAPARAAQSNNHSDSDSSHPIDTSRGVNEVIEELSLPAPSTNGGNSSCDVLQSITAPSGLTKPAEGASVSGTKTGVFGRIKPRKREELGAVLTQEIPLRLPSDYHQVFPIDVDGGEGVVYSIKVALPAEQEEKTYIIHSAVVEEALNRTEAGDPTFAVLTPIDFNLGGTVRAYEMYPWVERSGRFGFWPVVVGIKDNPRSMAPYLIRRIDIEENKGLWIRRTRGITIAAPPGSVWSPPKWPEAILNGGIDNLVLRAYNGRVISSLDSDEAKWLAGIISI